jgi:hypothetical protein
LRNRKRKAGKMVEALKEIVKALQGSADNQKQFLDILKTLSSRVTALEDKVLILQAERVSDGKQV